MQEKEILRIQGERKKIALLEYYIIVVSDKRIVIGKIWRGHTNFFALSAEWGKYNDMTIEEILNANEGNFEITFEDVKFKDGLFTGVMIVRNRKGKAIKIRMIKRDFNKLQNFFKILKRNY